MSVYETASIIISVLTLFLFVCTGLIAWGRMQGWKESTEEKITDINDRLEKTEEMASNSKYCLDRVAELTGKLFALDGSTSYTTREDCKMHNRMLKENFSSQIQNIKDMIETRNAIFDETNRSIKEALTKVLLAVERDKHEHYVHRQ